MMTVDDVFGGSATADFLRYTVKKSLQLQLRNSSLQSSFPSYGQVGERSYSVPALWSSPRQTRLVNPKSISRQWFFLIRRPCQDLLDRGNLRACDDRSGYAIRR